MGQKTKKMKKKNDRMIIENSIGWEGRDGIQIALKPEFAFMNCCRKEEFRTPIWREDDLRN